MNKYRITPEQIKKHNEFKPRSAGESMYERDENYDENVNFLRKAFGME